MNSDVNDPLKGVFHWQQQKQQQQQPDTDEHMTSTFVGNGSSYYH